MDQVPLDAMGGAITLLGGGFAKLWTDLFRGGWGGKLEKQPPWQAMAIAAFVFGFLGAVVACLILKINPLDNLAALFTYGTTATSTAMATTMVHNKVRPMLAPPVADTPQLAQVAKFEPRPPAVPEPDASATEVQLQVVAPAVPPAAPPVTEPVVAPALSPRDRILAAAASYEGRPYVFGATGPDAFDCSGYVLAVYRDAGLPITGARTAQQIADACTAIPIGNVQPGDILFFAGTYPSPDRITHVGISLGAGTMRMWNAVESQITGVNAVQLTDISTNYWQDAIAGAGRHPQLTTTPTDSARNTAANGLIPAIDVSSHQPRDLSGLLTQFAPQHVIVKLAQTAELAGLRDHAKAQIASLKAAGVSIGGYVWLYQSIDTERQVDDALSLAAEAGITLPRLWVDVEHYPSDGSCPTAEQVGAALNRCALAGVRGGIYTGKYIWESLGNPSFSGVELWYAHYNGRPVIDTPQYGDMLPVGHQWTSTPIDQNVFLPEVCG